MAEWGNAELIFAQQWWWKAVCPPQALRLIKTPSGSFWPVATIRRMGLFNVYAMPPLTQHAGPYLTDRKDFISLLEQIPSKAQVCLNVGFKLNETEIRIAQQKGFKVVERHSHRIEDLSDLNKVFANIKPAERRRQIRKAQRELKVQECNDIEQLVRLQTETFKRRKRALPYSPDTLRRLYAAVKEHDAGQLIALINADGQVIACGLFVHDQSTCYSLVHGFHKMTQNLAGSLLQWEGIRYAAEKKLIFDFEGSDIESIAKFNLSFGAIPKTYFRLERYSTFFRIMEGLWRFVKRMSRYR